MIWFQVLASGLSLAGYYALLSLGFALIFSTFKIFHIAHAAVFGAAGYVFFALHRSFGWDVWTAGALAVVSASIIGWLTDILLYRPILRRGGGLFALFIASLGFTLIFEALFLGVTGGALSVAREGAMRVFIVGPVAVRLYDLAIVGVVAVLYALVYLWVMRTRTGSAIRALSDNEGLANVVGVNTLRTRHAVFLVASALAGVAGVFSAFDSGMTPTAGTNVLFIIFVAVLVGGALNIFLGAIIGSLLMGVVTAGAGFINPQWVSVCVFGILILLLVFRPRGLLS